MLGHGIKPLIKVKLWELIMMYMIYANIYTLTLELNVNIQYLIDNIPNYIKILSLKYKVF